MHRLVASFFLSSFDDCPDEIETQRLPQDALVGPVVGWLTSVLLYQFAATGACGDFIVDSFEDEEDNDREKYRDGRRAAGQ